MKRVPNPWRSVFRAAWGGYTALLVTATHWPGMVINGPIDRTDLVIHVGAFSTWASLFSLADFFGSCSCGKRRLVWTLVCGLCFAVFDETTQPLFDRQFDWWDLGADCVGVLLGVGVIETLRRVLGQGRASDDVAI